MAASRLENIGRKLFACRIDEQFISILNETFFKQMNDITPLVNQFKPEFEIIVYSLYYYYSMVLNKPTPGMAALNISFESRNKYFFIRFLKYLTLIFSISIFGRLKYMSLLQGWRAEDEDSNKRLLWKSLTTIELIFKILGLSNFLLFIHNGIYPTLLNRLMSYEMIPRSNLNNDGLSKYISFKGRQVAWQIGLSILSSMTLMRSWNEIITINNNISSINQTIQNVTMSAFKTVSKFILPKFLTSYQTEERRPDSLNFAFTEINSKTVRSDIHMYPTVCCLCLNKPAEIPHYLTCGHIYCYICTQLNLLTEINNQSSYSCVICKKLQSECIPLSGNFSK